MERGLPLLGTLQKGAQQDEANAFLEALMTTIEANRQSYGIVAEQKLEDAGLITRHAFAIYKPADDMDRSGAPDESTARAFMSASTLLDVAFDLGIQEQELQKLKKYAKGRAADIIRAKQRGVPIPPAAGSSDVFGGELLFPSSVFS